MLPDKFLETPNHLVTTYLEMSTPAQLRAALVNAEDVEIRRLQHLDLAFYRFLYQSVGEFYRWRDRLVMPESQLRDALLRSEVHVLYVGGVPAGYVELAPEEDGSIEVAYFGLRPGFTGRGLGKHLLSFGVARAWEMGARRVWLHTCNLDSPAALPNYLARGFEVVETRREPMPTLYQ